jgi:inward rectifier potassium channel
MPDGRATTRPVRSDAAAPKPSSARRRRRQVPEVHSAPPDGVEARLNHLIARDTADEVLALGLSRPWFGDLYHRILTIGWLSFFAAALAGYVAANIIFALLYLAQPGSITNARPGTFADAFFFSVETISTIGYGQMVPATLYANLVMTAESAVGLLFVALATGLIFARFSRPTARVLFSRVAVIGPHNGRPTLSLRIANVRQNQILSAEVSMTLVRDEISAEGDRRRRFYDLHLTRQRSPVFALTFTVMHEIDRNSPLRESDADALAAVNAELVVTASGIDETLVAPVHARTSYLPHEILWNRRFVDVLGWTADGRRVIDYRRFHDTEPLATPAGDV